MATKHTLTADGAPFDARGRNIGSGSGTAGAGRAKCGCGWLSEELPSRAARKMAHNGHKSAPDPKPKTTPTAPKKAAAEPAQELKGIVTEVPYAGVPKVHFKWLGQEVARAYAESIEGISGVAVDARTKMVQVAGTAAARKSVAKGLPQLWKDAEAALRANDKSRKDELRELNKTPQGRRSRIPAEGEFLVKYCEDMIAAGLI